MHYVAAAGAFESDYIGTGTYAVAVTAGSAPDDAALRSTGCSGVPSAPTGVDALAGTGNVRALVLWTASSDTTVTGYEVLRGRSGHDMTRIGTVTGRSTSQYDDSGAQWETTYVYGVRAVNANGVSARSETASVTTLQALPAEPPSERADEGPNANDDAPRGPSTAARVAVDGGAKEGNLNGLYCISIAYPVALLTRHTRGGDYDWWKFDLVAGKTYRVELRGKSTGDGTAENFAVNGIFDPGVTHAGPSYSSGHSDYTNRGGTVSVTFTAMQTGTHHVEVSSLGRFYYAPHSNHDKCAAADVHLALGAPEGDRGTYKIEVTELTSLPPEAASATALTLGTAHDGGVFALDEGVVVGLAGAGLGELADMQLVEQRRDPLVDVLGAIVGVESLDWKGIRLEARFEHGEEKAFGDGLDAADVLVVCDLVDGVDVIHPLDAIEVALVNGVDA